MTEKILVTTALPYANGEIHLGHLLEHIQTDIWVRFQRLMGKECVYVCADDAHGTATTLTAEKEGKDVLQWIDEMRLSHEKDLRAFGVSYDNYYTTHSEENRILSEDIYERVKEKGHINVREVRQLFDTKRNMFLADRFIKGECPSCGTADQYGDNCESCGATYNALELKNPYSLLSDTPPVVKESEHLFFNLPVFEAMIKEWMDAGSIQKEVRNKLEEWFKKGLQEWNISRDAPYFGWLIPGYESKYFYVWLDAPIGYMASLKNLCTKKGWEFDDFWRNKQSEYKIYHFIGKDIVYFHSLFWPALLHAADYNKPTGVFAHGFLTVNGAKMSKSRGTFILAKSYLQHLDAEYLRYYFATKLGDGIDDMDFNTAEFGERVNSDLVGKFVNIASRCARFINRDFANQLGEMPESNQQELIKKLINGGDKIAELYQTRKFSAAVRCIMEYADATNRYLEEEKPWKLSAANPQDIRVQQICTTGLNCFWILAIYLAPVIPKLSSKAKELLKLNNLNWQSINTPITSHEIEDFSPLMQRVPAESIATLINS